MVQTWGRCIGQAFPSDPRTVHWGILWDILSLIILNFDILYIFVHPCVCLHLNGKKKTIQESKFVAPWRIFRSSFDYLKLILKYLSFIILRPILNISNNTKTLSQKISYSRSKVSLALSLTIWLTHYLSIIEKRLPWDLYNFLLIANNFGHYCIFIRSEASI